MTEVHYIHCSCGLMHNVLMSCEEAKIIEAGYDKQFGSSVGMVRNMIDIENSINHDESVLHKEIWNEAIEACAKYIEDNGNELLAADQIRSLKK